MSAFTAKSSTKSSNQQHNLGDRDKDREKHTQLRVAYDYEYDYKTRKISITQGEILHLLQKTNQHWWKVVRPGVNKAFFVPAQYVVIIEEASQHQPLKSSNENNNYTDSVFPLPSAIKSASNAATNSSGSAKSGIARNEGSRASHRIHSKANSSSASSATRLKNWSASLEELSKQIVFPGITSESVVDLTSLSNSSVSNSVLSKASVINKCLSFRNPAYNNNDPKTEGSTDQNPHSTDTPAEASSDVGGTANQPGSKQMKTNENIRPPIPSPTAVPTRILPDNWAEYHSDELKRYYYFNSETKLRSWKPPRNSSRRSDESLSSWRGNTSGHGSSLDKSLDNLSETDDACSVSSFGKKVNQINNYSINHQQIQNDSKVKESFVATIAKQIDSRNQDCAATSSGKEAAHINSAKESEDKDKSANISTSGGSKVSVPDDWQEVWDESLSQFCYVNKITGARWFTSTDPQGKIYFYEENSSKSSWFLPVPGITLTSHSQDEKQSPASETKDRNASGDTFDYGKEAGSSSSTLAPRPETRTPTSVKKRHSTGDVVDRFQKSKSMLLPDFKKTNVSSDTKSSSLPRSPTIWKGGQPNIYREGLLARTKITENGKKVRKNWAAVYAVLTESHLSLFKDQKAFTASAKSEVEIELEGGVTMEWTEEKSSRKNVFQLNTRSDLQMLFQSDDKDTASAWFDDIKSIVDKSDNLDFSLRLRSTESPETLLDVPIGERKSSRLNRNKSTKLKISGSIDDIAITERRRITDNLKKFFHRRPPRESLIKKGIYKDESVFGCSLEKLCALEKRTVPKFVEDCIVAIESKTENLKTDGIYRASGNLSLVQKIRLKVDQHDMACVFQEEDVHVLAGSLKLFFREMREPLIPYDLFEKSLQACSLQNNKEKINKFREIVDALAKPNRHTLQALLKHLLKVAEYSEFNRMQIPNLAIVFGPTLMWPATESTNMALDLMKQNLVIEALLSEFDNIYR